MKTGDFDYALPPDRIAQEPLPERAAARMLVLRCAAGRIEHRCVGELPEYLRAGDLLLVNDTRVIPARVFGRRTDTGGRVELLFVEQTAPAEWECLCRASGRPAPGTVFELAEGRWRVEVLERLAGGRLRVRCPAERPLLDLLAEDGATPLPPYIRRTPGDAARADLDRARYQTVYAARPGAVAAPTAGLHFSPALLERLERAGVERAAVTLHVGPGTFRPVQTERVADHRLEAERYEIPAATAAAFRAARARGSRWLSVGTTTVRALETAAARQGDLTAGGGRSDLFIYPPYDFRATDMLLTNFHLPRSTLLMLVCALAGWRRRRAGAARPDEEGRDLVLQAYAEAVRERYRFYSYGDCMLLLD
mgnify:CR=1 FL=1